jgi:hypothetical protein
VTILPDGGDRYLSEPMLLDGDVNERPARFGQSQQPGA